MLVVAGPTGTGKTELAAALARRLGGEVVSADSRQVYRRLDAATAKPSAALRAAVPHHLIDVAEPSETYDAGRFAREAAAAISDIRRRGKLPIVCGGTGLYLKALLEGLAPLPPRDEAVRARLEREAEGAGRAALHARLAAADPKAAAAIPAGNLQRVVRALEVLELTGKPLSEHWAEGREGAVPASLALVLELPADVLRARLEKRCAAMWPALLAEVKALVPKTLRGGEPGLSSLGYREALACISGALPEAEGLAAFTAATLAYAKRQRTWFRRQLPGAVAVDASDASLVDRAAALWRDHAKAAAAR